MKHIFLILMLVFSSVVAAVMVPLEKPAILLDTQRTEFMDALEKENFAEGTMKEKVKKYIADLDFKDLQEKDLVLVDKYVQRVTDDKDIANKYFAKISDGRMKLETGKDLTWDGELLKTKSGASIDPKEIPRNVLSVRESEGKLIFTYTPIELVEVKREDVKHLGKGKPAKVTLLKGMFESGGDGGEITQPSENAVFTVEDGDVIIGGVGYYPNKGKIEQLGGTNFRIIVDDLSDEYATGLIIEGTNRGLPADIEVYATQKETFVGTNKALFDKAVNGLYIEGTELHAKGNFDLDLSDHYKDEHFAEYTFENGLLNVQGRDVTDQETESSMTLIYKKEGKKVIWDVDGDDFKEAPLGISGAGGHSEVRRNDEKAGLILEEPPEEAGVPLQKIKPKPVEEEETTTEEEKPAEKRPEEKPAQRTPVQKRVQTQDEEVIASIKSAAGESLIVPKDALSEEIKANVRARSATEFSFLAYSKKQVKKQIQDNYKSLNPSEKKIAEEFKQTHEADLENWLADNMGGGVNKFKARMVGDKAVLEIYGGRSYFVIDKIYLPMLRKTLSYSIF